MDFQTAVAEDRQNTVLASFLLKTSLYSSDIQHCQTRKATLMSALTWREIHSVSYIKQKPSKIFWQCIEIKDMKSIRLIQRMMTKAREHFRDGKVCDHLPSRGMHHAACSPESLRRVQRHIFGYSCFGTK